MTTESTLEITARTPPAETPTFINLPVDDWTDDEVIFYYDLYLAARAVSELSVK